MKKLIKKVLMTLISLFKWEKKIPIVSIKESSNLLEGKVALITGGSGGIGMAIAKSLLESGCKVIIAGTNEQKLKQSIEILQNDAKYVILNMNDISSFRDKINSGVVVLLSNCDGKVNLVAMATKDTLNKGIHCGNIIREVAKVVNGGGGGRPDMAQAGGKDPSKIEEAVSKVCEIVKSLVK